MVEEVEIKIKADASEAKKAFRDIHFYEKALQEDTELLKDLQVEYQQALAETGGKITGKALKIHKEILDVRASIAKSERAIEKSGKGQLKNLFKMSKFGRAFSGKLAMAGTVGAVAGGFLIAKKLAESVGEKAQAVFSERLSSVTTGMSVSQYSGHRAQGAISGVQGNNLGNLISNIETQLYNIKHGYEGFDGLIEFQNRTGKAITDAKGQYKDTQTILKDIQDYVRTQKESDAYNALRGLGITPDVIYAIKNGSITENKMYATSEEESKRLAEVAKDMRRMEESAKKRNTALASFFAPVSQGWYGLRADINELLISWLSPKEKDNRTEEQKQWAELKNKGYQEYQKYKDQEKDFYAKALKSNFEKDVTYNLQKAANASKKAEDRIRAINENNVMALKTGDYDRYLKRDLDVAPVARRKSLEEYQDILMHDRKRQGIFIDANGKRWKNEGGETWEVLDLSRTVPEKSASLTGGNVSTSNKNVAINENITVYGIERPEDVGPAVNKANNDALNLAVT